jgi:hypothetical protein
MSIYQQTDYRTAIKELLIFLKENHGKSSYSFSAMAELMRVRHTYLSTVLSGNGHLNSDQVFLAAKYLNMSDEDYEFLALLHELNRSVSEERQPVLKSKIESLKIRYLQTETHTKSRTMSMPQSEHLLEFYLDTNAIFVHMFLTVPSYAANPNKIRDQLNLSPSAFQASLRHCERAGLIEWVDAKVKVLVDDIHLPSSSPLFPAYRVAMRLKALERLQATKDEQDYTITALYSASLESQSRVREKFLEFLKWVQKYTQSGKSDHVFQMNFDLLRWG